MGRKNPWNATSQVKIPFYAWGVYNRGGGITLPVGPSKYPYRSAKRPAFKPASGQIIRKMQSSSLFVGLIFWLACSEHFVRWRFGANSLEFSRNPLKLSADNMYRACELKDQTCKKTRTLHFSEIRGPKAACRRPHKEDRCTKHYLWSLFWWHCHVSSCPAYLT